MGRNKRKKNKNRSKRKTEAEATDSPKKTNNKNLDSPSDEKKDPARIHPQEEEKKEEGPENEQQVKLIEKEEEKKEDEEDIKRKKREEAEILRRIMNKRDQDRHMGLTAMRRHEFDKATVHFENYLKFSSMDSPEVLHHVLQNLIICRLQGRNRRENIERCVKDCDMILSRTPDDMNVHLAKINALTRLLDFTGAARAIRTAVEQDQQKNIELLHSFLFCLADQTSKIPFQTIRHRLNLPLPIEQIRSTYLSLTLPSRQNLFSFTWEQIHEAIDSPLCLDMIPPGSRPKIQHFLHKCLDYNILPESRESQLYFLKQELGCLIAQKLWNHFELPETRPPYNIPLEKYFIYTESNSPSNNVSILAENGTYFAHEGSEFVSSACIDSISHMTHILGVRRDEDNKKLFVNVAQLYDLGFDLMAFLSENTHSDYTVLLNENSPAAKATDEDWDRFAEFRIKWHEKLDLRAIETLTPPKDNDDPKYFESRLEDVLGAEKTKELLQVEFEASKPILEKYAEIISEISGIDQETILAELTEEDDFLGTANADGPIFDENGNLVEPKSENEKKYEPMGISLLVQSTQFDLKPSNSEENVYDKQKILEKLRALEKDVVQFQINYKKVVFDAAGEQKEALQDVMQNISFKGLELTKWLRGFVHYMLDRRDIEQELLDYCGAEDAAGWSKWFENLGINMSAAQSILLCLIARLFVCNVCHVGRELEKQKKEVASDVVLKEEEDVNDVKEEEISENTEEKNTTEPAPEAEEIPTETPESIKKREEEDLDKFLEVDPSLDASFMADYIRELPRFQAAAGHRLENLSDTRTHIAAINDISQPLMSDLSKIKKALLSDEVPAAIEEWLENSTQDPILEQKIATLKRKIGVPNLIIPCVNVKLPVQYILKFLGTGYNYHKETSEFSFLSGANEDLKVMSLMMDQTCTSQETLFHLVYSSVDEKVLGFPTRRSIIGIPNISLCQNCEKVFGTLHCQKCSVAHYCSKQCQVAKWESHRVECKRWREMTKKIQYYHL